MGIQVTYLCDICGKPIDDKQLVTVGVAGDSVKVAPANKVYHDYCYLATIAPVLK